MHAIITKNIFTWNIACYHPDQCMLQSDIEAWPIINQILPCIKFPFITILLSICCVIVSTTLSSTLVICHVITVSSTTLTTYLLNKFVEPQVRIEPVDDGFDVLQLLKQ